MLLLSVVRHKVLLLHLTANLPRQILRGQIFSQRDRQQLSYVSRLVLHFKILADLYKQAGDGTATNCAHPHGRGVLDLYDPARKPQLTDRRTPST